MKKVNQMFMGVIAVIITILILGALLSGIGKLAEAFLASVFGFILLPALIIAVPSMYFYRRKVEYQTTETFDKAYYFLTELLKGGFLIVLILVVAGMVEIINSDEFVLCFQDPSTPGKEILMKDEFGKPFCMKDWRG